MDKGKPSKKKGSHRNRRRDLAASDKQIGWHKVGKQLCKSGDQSDSDQEVRPTQPCRYPKRKMKQPRARLGDLDDIWNATSVGKNFEVLANAPLATNSFVFKSEKNWALDVSKYDSYFSIDVKNLAEIINCIPFNKLVQVDDKYFTEDERTAMNNIAEKAEESYKAALEIERQKELAAEEERRRQETQEIEAMNGQSTSSQKPAEKPTGIYISGPISFHQAQELLSDYNMSQLISSHQSDEMAGTSNMCEPMLYLDTEDLAESFNMTQSVSSCESSDTIGSPNTNQPTSSKSCTEQPSSSDADQPGPSGLWGEIPDAPEIYHSKFSRPQKKTTADSKAMLAPSRRSGETSGAVTTSQPLLSRQTADKACGPDANQPAQSPKTEDKACGPDSSLLLVPIRRFDGRAGTIDPDQRNPAPRSEEKPRAQSKQLVSSTDEATTESKKNDDDDDDLEFLLSLQEPVRAPPVATNVSPPKKSTHEPKTKTSSDTSKPHDLENWLEMVLDD